MLYHTPSSYQTSSPAHTPAWSVNCIVLILGFYDLMFHLCLLQQNKPLNSQNVADALQKYNLKKTAVQKALDTLSDSGQISFKEYGKQKIYLARQDQFNIPNSEELDQMKKENSKLQEELVDQKKAMAEVQAGMVFSFYDVIPLWLKSGRSITISNRCLRHHLVVMSKSLNCS